MVCIEGVGVGIRGLYFRPIRAGIAEIIIIDNPF
jgi:hypothetical protein